ncbi:MAG: cyclophane-forming radical SAM peptide maturase AmcB [Pseudonocardiaceae bacterium]
MTDTRSRLGVSHWLTSQPDTIILQPTSLCPLACTYCYLPERHFKQDMAPTVAAAVAAGIQPDWAPIEVVWHGGEPLAIGLARFAELLEQFEPLRQVGRVQHKVQTGATLITDAWCELFERYEIGVGVSIDGPRSANHHRVDRAGRPMFDRIVAGIDTLKRHEIPFIVLAVVSQDGTSRAHDVLDFLRDLGSAWVGFNIEAREGANVRGDTPAMEQAQRFWRDTFTWCKENREMTVREVERLLRFIGLKSETRAVDARHDLIPTIGWNGDVVLLSPELLGVRDARYHDFVVGNVLADSLVPILDRAANVSYVQEFLIGLERCKTTCEFFSYCQGAHAGDRYFEHGTFMATETEHCKTSVQAPVLALADLVNRKEKK